MNELVEMVGHSAHLAHQSCDVSNGVPMSGLFDLWLLRFENSQKFMVETVKNQINLNSPQFYWRISTIRDTPSKRQIQEKLDEHQTHCHTRLIYGWKIKEKQPEKHVNFLGIRGG